MFGPLLTIAGDGAPAEQRNFNSEALQLEVGGCNEPPPNDTFEAGDCEPRGIVPDAAHYANQPSIVNDSPSIAANVAPEACSPVVHAAKDDCNLDAPFQQPRCARLLCTLIAMALSFTNKCPRYVTLCAYLWLRQRQRQRFRPNRLRIDGQQNVLATSADPRSEPAPALSLVGCQSWEAVD